MGTRCRLSLWVLSCSGGESLRQQILDDEDVDDLVFRSDDAFNEGSACFRHDFRGRLNVFGRRHHDVGNHLDEQADRLAETLLAWLESADNAGAAARHLHVHPQTVRYRLRQLTELFGDRLIDPDARFTLQVALRIRQLIGAS